MARRPQSRRRGRTRPGRLRLLDPLVGKGPLSLPQTASLCVVDVGIGDDLATTLELLATLRAADPERRVELYGVENEPERAARLRAAVRDDCIEVLTGGFARLGTLPSRAHLIRVMNVLRGYGLDEVRPAQESMIDSLTSGGLLIEGSCDAEGHVLGAHLWRKLDPGKAKYEGLLLATDFSRGFAPWMFRDVLPRDLRRHAVPPEPIANWLLSWHEVVADLRLRRRWENPVLFCESLRQLSAENQDTYLAWADRGVVVWTPHTPSPRREVLAAHP